MEKEIINIIDFWQGVLKDKNIYPRLAMDKINLNTKEITVLTGIRRSGKSFILNLIINKLNLKDKSLYINFEDPFFVENSNLLIIEKIIAVYQEYFNKDLKYLFFDEIQNIDKWENAIRKLRESGRYKIFITGSSSKLLSKEISTLLTGRHLSYEVFPLSFKEYLRFKGLDKLSKKDIALREEFIKKNFNEYIKVGGFPEIAITKNFQLLKNYFYDILYKDIVARYEIREKDILEKIALFLIANYSKIVTFEAIKKNYNISFDLASKYIEYLREAFLIFSLPQFSFSVKKQANLPKKNYVADIGLSNTVSFQFSGNEGRNLENIVFLELKRKGEELYYYRGNKECDFIIKRGLKAVSAIQVTQKITERNKKREIGGLVEAMDELKIKNSFILTENQNDKIIINGKKILVFPIWKWLLE